VETESAAEGGRTEGGDMLRRSQLIGVTALSLACSLPASAAVAQQDLRSPDTRDAATASKQEAPAPPSSMGGPGGNGNQDLRMPDTRDAAGGAATVRPAQPRQDLRSPDARDAARDLPPVHVQMPVIHVREVPSGGFDWGDAGIGAAGMLALFSIGAGSTLLVTNRRRRRGFQAAAH
jgi:hypothetical protein